MNRDLIALRPLVYRRPGPITPLELAVKLRQYHALWDLQPGSADVTLFGAWFEPGGDLVNGRKVGVRVVGGIRRGRAMLDVVDARGKEYRIDPNDGTIEVMIRWADPNASP
jgi:hypothetical protein